MTILLQSEQKRGVLYSLYIYTIQVYEYLYKQFPGKPAAEVSNRINLEEMGMWQADSPSCDVL